MSWSIYCQGTPLLGAPTVDAVVSRNKRFSSVPKRHFSLNTAEVDRAGWWLKWLSRDDLWMSLKRPFGGHKSHTGSVLWFWCRESTQTGRPSTPNITILLNCKLFSLSLIISTEELKCWLSAYLHLSRCTFVDKTQAVQTKLLFSSFLFPVLRQFLAVSLPFAVFTAFCIKHQMYFPVCVCVCNLCLSECGFLWAGIWWGFGRHAHVV